MLLVRSTQVVFNEIPLLFTCHSSASEQDDALLAWTHMAAQTPRVATKLGHSVVLSVGNFRERPNTGRGAMKFAGQTGQDANVWSIRSRQCLRA